MDAVEASNHRCDGPHLQFMTHLQHVLIEPEATPMRLMPCVPPTQTGLPLPSTRLQVFSAHGNAVAAAAAATEANLCSTPSSSDGVERIFAFPEGRAPSGASVHRFDAAVVSTVAPPSAAALAAAPEAATARRRRRPRRQIRRKQRPGRPHRRPDPREGQPPYSHRKKRLGRLCFIDELDDRSERMIGALSSELMRLEVLKLDSLILTHDLITGKGVRAAEGTQPT